MYQRKIRFDPTVRNQLEKVSSDTQEIRTILHLRKYKGQKVDCGKKLDYTDPVSGNEMEDTGKENYAEKFQKKETLARNEECESRSLTGEPDDCRASPNENAAIDHGPSGENLVVDRCHCKPNGTRKVRQRSSKPKSMDKFSSAEIFKASRIFVKSLGSRVLSFSAAKKSN